MKFFFRWMRQSGLKCPLAHKHKADAGHDLAVAEDGVVAPHSVRTFGTNLRVQIPEGFYADLRPRSSTVARGLLVDGTIDAGYNGEVKISLVNVTDFPVSINAGERPAQLILHRLPEAEWELVDGEPPQSERGCKGFGSTGK